MAPRAPIHSPAPAPLLVRRDDWPALHQQLWQAGTDPRALDADGDPPHGSTLSEATRLNAMKGWCRFLATLPPGEARTGPPAAQVNPASIRAFLAALEAAGNARTTIAARLWEVRTALTIMCPGENFRWVTSPGGASVRSHLQDPSPRRPAKVNNSLHLYDLGLSLMDRADGEDNPRRRAVVFRNGLLVALFACRAPRLRTMAACRIGVHLVPGQAGYRLEFGKADLKRRRFLEYDLPAGLTVRIRRYVEVERPVLLHGQRHDWLWVGRDGRRLNTEGISGMLRRLSAACGMDFSAHSFRHAMATMAALADPRNPAMASTILNNSAATVEKHYNMGRQVDAALEFQKAVDRQRRDSAGLARRAFKRG